MLGRCARCLVLRWMRFRRGWTRFVLVFGSRFVRILAVLSILSLCSSLHFPSLSCFTLLQRLYTLALAKLLASFADESDLVDRVAAGLRVDRVPQSRYPRYFTLTLTALYLKSPHIAHSQLETPSQRSFLPLASHHNRSSPPTPSPAFATTPVTYSD